MTILTLTNKKKDKTNGNFTWQKFLILKTNIKKENKKIKLGLSARKSEIN